MPITWRTALCHPQMPLEGQLNVVDPDRRLSKIGGLHPMAHMGSYNNEFIQGPYYLNPQELSWSQLKSGAIICEWLSRYLNENGVQCKILNQKDYELALQLKEGNQSHFSAEANKYRANLRDKIIDCQDPEVRERLYSKWEKLQFDLSVLEELSKPYRDVRAQAINFLAEIFNSLHDPRHAMLIPTQMPIFSISHFEFYDKNKNSDMKTLKVPAPRIFEIYSYKEQKLRNSLHYELQRNDNALAKNPNSSYAYYCRGVILHKLNRHQEAYKSFKKSIELDKTPPAETYFKCGVVAYELDEKENALEFFNNALEINPSHPSALYYVGLLLQAQSLYEGALIYFDESLEYRPNNADVLYKRAYVLFKLGHINDALEDCKSSLTINPDSALVWALQAIIFYELGQNAKAVECYEKALKIEPRSADNLYNCGLIYMELGQITRAIVCFTKFSKLQPHDMQGIAKRQAILDKANYPLKAIDKFEFKSAITSFLTTFGRTSGKSLLTSANIGKDQEFNSASLPLTSRSQ